MKNFHFFVIYFSKFSKKNDHRVLNLLLWQFTFKAHPHIEVKTLDFSCLSRSFYVFSPYSRKEFLKVFKEESLLIILMIIFYSNLYIVKRTIFSLIRSRFFWGCNFFNLFIVSNFFKSRFSCTRW